MSDSGLVVDTAEVTDGGWFSSDTVKQHGSVIIIVVLIVIVISVAYCKKESFASPDGVVSRRSQRQNRSDTEVDRTWNLDELEKSVALINRKAGNSV